MVMSWPLSCPAPLLCSSLHPSLVNNLPSFFLSLSFPHFVDIVSCWNGPVLIDCSRAAEPKETLVKASAWHIRRDDLHSLSYRGRGQTLRDSEVGRVHWSHSVHGCPPRDGWLASFRDGCRRVNLDFMDTLSPRSLWDRNVTSTSRSLSLHLRATCLGRLGRGWNNHIRQKDDCCAWARSHCSGISANKELNALLVYGCVCGACAWILWDGGRWCCQAGKWGWQGVGAVSCVHMGGRGQREWTTHEYYGSDGGVEGVGGRGGGGGEVERWQCHMGYRGSRRRCWWRHAARECMCTRIHACLRGIQAIVTDNGQT